jgi:acetyl esterase/lipase
MRPFLPAAALLLLAAAGPPPLTPPQPLPPPTDLAQIPVQPGAPTLSRGELWENFLGQRIVRDVTAPTITPFLPDAGHASGAAVLVVPGGGFLFNSIDNEGTKVARWLAAHGIAAFVLKYRLEPSPPDPAAFLKSTAARFHPPSPAELQKLLASPQANAAAQDAAAALALLRTEAARFHIDPARIGILGFSAGAITAMKLAQQHNAADHPDFVAAIYGAAQPRPVPPDAAPLFLAVAADDPLLAANSAPIFEAWHKAGKSAELHVFAAGGHGFGLVSHGTTSDHWIDEFYWWLQAEHMT